MPIFATTDPIALKLELRAAEVHLLAGPHEEGTTVDVVPADDTAASVKAAASTTVEFSGGQLEIRTPKDRAPLFGRGSRLSPKYTGDGTVKVTVRLAAGSTVKGVAGLAQLNGAGRLGECRFTAGSGDIVLGETGPLWVETALGAVFVEAVAGSAHVVAAQGKVEIGRAEGTVDVRNTSGATRLGQVCGAVKVAGVNGVVTVDRADSDVEVKVTNGDIRIGQVRTGSVRLETTVGAVEVGVRAGTSALLDVSSLVGGVANDLDDADGPTGTDRVKISARTLHGDVWVHRA
ncbi:DUF4097 family beta strand repeat protein [Catenulispora sp. NF23]|uniref:DUF4097 family beta strand repeat-containing protein n=1 Tax=Catenulispora pinistramenti TaxID=2705254 RepID=UPI001BAAFA2C|nr:DUF4097 family beta strand repeat-containing protein [Catenulispora pinistramenti]MBS2533708.1 DUF4097 family beta strand repeat protein [Catenulispora pinistramenti]